MQLSLELDPLIVLPCCKQLKRRSEMDAELNIAAAFELTFHGKSALSLCVERLW